MKKKTVSLATIIAAAVALERKRIEEALPKQKERCRCMDPHNLEVKAFNECLAIVTKIINPQSNGKE